MHTQTEPYLSHLIELFRPQDQKNFISDVKRRYKELRDIEWEIKRLLGDPCNFIFDEILSSPIKFCAIFINLLHLFQIFILSSTCPKEEIWKKC